MGFCSPKEHKRFLERCPVVEKFIIDGGARLIKIWLKVGQGEQERCFKAHLDDPIRQWKFSPMDIQSYDRRYDYPRARDMMFEYTDTDHAPWRVVRSHDKKRARLSVIAHILSQIPYKKVDRPKVKLPPRSGKEKVRRSGVDCRSTAGGTAVLSLPKQLEIDGGGGNVFARFAAQRLARDRSISSSR